VVRYGNSRELCLGLEVVSAQGEIWHGLSGLRKDNTGYDLRNLMIGSEGTLGVITAACMKIYPQPVAQLTALAAVPSMEAAMENGWVTDAVVAESLAQAKSLWQIRETIPLAQVDEGLNIKHDISVPVSLIPQFVAETDALLQSKIPGIRLVNFGHLGDGNLHYNVQAPPGADGPAFLRDHEEEVNTWVFDQVQAFNGSISAEHGIGSLKADKLTHHKDPTALAMMKAIKQALDPQNIMNPGRVIKI
jgi:FAD/FMN-containing dehydrogenase